ncbi:MAG: ADP-ribosylation factor-like protein [Candidatus Odinarchaeota archaeon]
MSQVRIPAGIIGIAVTWDAVQGRPNMVSVVPDGILSDPEKICMNIWMASVTFFGQEKTVSRIELSLPFSSIFLDHVVRVAFDTWEPAENSDNETSCFIAFIMDNRTATKLENYLSIAIWNFLDDFKREKEKFDLHPAWNRTNIFLQQVSSKETLQKDIFDQYKVVLAGLSFAGKTSILNRVVKGVFLNPEPTPGFTTEIIQRGNAKFQVIDLGGQDAFIQTLWKPLLAQTDALVYVIDSSNIGDLPKARNILSTAMMWAKDIKILLILANKQDLPEASGRDEIIEHLDLASLIEKYRVEKFFIAGTSAKTNEGIDEAFTWLARQLTKQEEVSTTKIHLIEVLKKNPMNKNQERLKQLIQIVFDTDGYQFLHTETYKTIREFIEKSHQDKIIMVEMEGSSGVKYRIDFLERKEISCLILSDIASDYKLTRAISNSLLDYTIDQDMIEEPVSEEVIQEIVSPFIQKPEEGFQDLTSKVQELQESQRKKSVVREEKSRLAPDSFFNKLKVLDNVRIFSEEESDWNELSFGDVIKVLCIDDEEDFLILEKKSLEKKDPNIHVDTISSPLEALKELEKRKFDIIVIDYLMPEMTGIELVKRIREKDRDIPIILFSARESNELKHLVTYFGGNEYIQKKQNSNKAFIELKNCIIRLISGEKVETLHEEGEESTRIT